MSYVSAFFVIPLEHQRYIEGPPCFVFLNFTRFRQPSARLGGLLSGLV